MTCGTLIFENDFQLFLASENRVLKSNVHTCTKVGALHRSVVGPSGSASAAEQVSEDISEDVSHICAVEVKSAKAAGSASTAIFKCRMTKLIILSSLVGIT